MKRIIELSENDYKELKEDGVQNHLALADTVIANSMPYDPQGDLISREALKKACSEMVRGSNNSDFIPCPSWNNAMELIDNAPTVDAISNDEGYEMYGKGYLQGYKRGKAEAIPKGEWEVPFMSDGRKFHKCTHCHISSMVILFDNFCPNCGADMKGGEKE